VRITGGTLKGRRIRAPAGKRLRPSTDKIRSAVFSVLGDDIPEAGVADLFCGSGAFGLEALSRGADFALFVDSSRQAIACVRKNIVELDLSRCAETIVMNVFDLRPAALKGVSIIFADPPYGMSCGDRLISLLCLKKFGYDGILALEHERTWKYGGERCGILKTIAFGDSSVTFLRISREGDGNR
jgi:16S rRNA (guanine966-N2)-methyltransferase